MREQEHTAGEPVVERGASFADHSCAPAWRRGVMMAVESLDALVGPTVFIRKKDTARAIEQVRDLLDELTNYARNANPATYRRAFELSEAFRIVQQRKRDDEKRAAIAKAQPPQEGGGSQ